MVWDLHRTGDFASAYFLPDNDLFTIGFDADDRLVQSTEAGLRLVDLRKGEVIPKEKMPAFDINAIRPSRQHEALLLGRNVFEPTMAVRTLSGELIGQEFAAFTIATTPDGSVIAYLAQDPDGPDASTQPEVRLRVWRGSQSPLAALNVPESASSLALDASGTHLLVNFSARPKVPARLTVYTTKDLKPLGSVDGQSLSLHGAIAPDGRTILVADGNALVTRSLPHLKVRRSVTLGGEIQDLAFADAGDRYAVADASGALSIFQANGDILTVRRAFFEGAQRAAIAFSPDGRLLAVQNSQAGRGGFLLLSLDADDLDRQLCERWTSEPTQQTWSAILPNDNPPWPCGAKITEAQKNARAD
jgi:hypothetical protein